MKKQEIIEHIVTWLIDYNAKAKTNGFVVGISGGIDSAVVSTLCAKTNLPVIVLEMPIHQAIDQVRLGKKHIEFLLSNYSNVCSLEVNLSSSYDTFVESINALNQINLNSELGFLTLSNTRSRMRMTTLYAIAGLHQMLVCGTGNKIEDFGIGFFTKYGDGGVDLSPIADLLKSEVYQLGSELGVHPEILNARPTDGLWDDGRTDEDQIGASYDELEWAMQIHDKFGDEPSESVFKNERELETWNIYIKRHKANKHKMVAIPVCLIPEGLK